MLSVIIVPFRPGFLAYHAGCTSRFAELLRHRCIAMQTCSKGILLLLRQCQRYKCMEIGERRK